MPLDLRITILGRPVKPVALGLALAMATLLTTGITGTGLLGGTHWGNAVAVAAAGALVLFVVGWVRGSQRLAEWALGGAFFAMAARTVFLFITAGAGQPAPWLSGALCIIAGGSYWLERVDGYRSRTDGRG